MGQVCVKPKKPKRSKIYAVPPGASAASVSYVSASSKDFTPLAPPVSIRKQIQAFTDQICTPISIAKYKTGKETLSCEFFGGAGCFVCNVSALQSLLLDDQTDIVSSNGSVLDKKALYEFIHPSNHRPTNVCVKIFFEEKGTINYTNERNAYSILKDILNDSFADFTTYAEYKDANGSHSAFTVRFGENFQVKIDGHPVHIIRCILFKRCTTDIQTLIENYNSKSIDSKKMFNDLTRMLCILHENGYAHCDIKPANIVYCPGETIEYKLIDFNLKHYSWLESPMSYTCKYILPRLFQEAAYPIRKIRENLTMDAMQYLKSYCYGGKQVFLLEKSYEEMKMTPIHHYTDAHLYYKSDEYALAMTLLELNDIQIEAILLTEDEWIRKTIDRLIQPGLYFKNPENCGASASRGGAKRKTKPRTNPKPKPTKTPLKDTSKKSSH